MLRARTRRVCTVVRWWLSAHASLSLSGGKSNTRITQWSKAQSSRDVPTHGSNLHAYSTYAICLSLSLCPGLFGRRRPNSLEERIWQDGSTFATHHQGPRGQTVNRVKLPIKHHCIGQFCAFVALFEPPSEMIVRSVVAW